MAAAMVPEYHVVGDVMPRLTPDSNERVGLAGRDVADPHDDTVGRVPRTAKWRSRSCAGAMIGQRQRMRLPD